MLFLAGAFLACREPTQVTLEISTNAECPAEPRVATMIVETGVVAGEPSAVSSPDAAPNTTTASCADGAIGSIVLYPEGGVKEAGALVVGRLHRDDLAGSIERCVAFANAVPGVGEDIDGGDCIVARRRVAFIDHVPLRLPIRLELACAGIRCAPDKTCVPGAPPDEGGLPCVSAEVSCDETGQCERLEGSGGGGAGGAGAGGGGTGGAGGGAEVVVTPIAPSLTLEQVAGLESTGDVYALDITAGAGTTVYRVEGDAVTTELEIGASVGFTTSRRLQVIQGRQGPVFGWDHDGAVVLSGDGTYTPLPGDPTLADFAVVDATRAVVVDGTDIVHDQTFSNTAVACAQRFGSAYTVARAAGQIYTAGTALCACGTCAGTAEVWHDMSVVPSGQFAVAVSDTSLISITPTLGLNLAGLLDGTEGFSLSRVHVTSQGGLWVAAGTTDAAGGTYIARGSVDVTGVIGAIFSSASLPDLGGIKSLWAAESPVPTAYVVTTAGKLYRIQGL